jgi:hypothetical protein
MKKTMIIGLCFAAVMFVGSASAMADLTALDSELDAMTVGGVTHINVNNPINDLLDSYWTNTAYGSVDAMIMQYTGAEYAANNPFGIYDPTDTSKKVEIFNGSASVGAVRVMFIDSAGHVWLDSMSGSPIATFGAGDVFGYYLTSPGGTFYSDTSKNGDKKDHMYAYQGVGDSMNLPGLSNPKLIGPSYYLLAWEDTYNFSGTLDYDDMVVLVESVMPVPIPGALLLGLLGLGITGLKLRKYA